MKHVLVATMALLLAACGSSGDDEPGQTTSSVGSRPVAAGDDSTSAVLDPQSRGEPLAKLRWVIDTLPVVGKPFRLRLLASAEEPAQLQVTITSETLLMDSSSTELQLLQEADSGSGGAYTASHDVSLSAQQEGWAEVYVRLGTGTESRQTVYVIPVLVTRPEAGPSPPRGSDKPDPAPEADNGNPKNT